VPDDDTGWGGTIDDGWAASPPPSPPAPPFNPVPPPPYPPSPPTQKRDRGRGWIYGVAVAVVVTAGAVTAIVLSTTGSKSSKNSGPTPVSSPPVTSSGPSPSASASGGNGSTLLSQAPFSGCVAAPSSSYNTSSVLDQIVCTGSDVSSSVSAQGVSYAKFSTLSDLNAWYSDTILKANGVTQDAGNCVTGVTVNTSGGASYCEGQFTNSNGTSARQLVALSPASINFRNGPNSTSADCQNSPYTLLIFTSPDDDVGVVALSCSATSATARAMESSLSAGSFDLN
jgi:hypothetical protein